MDIDIDDILNELDNYHPSETRDFQDLSRWWTTERAAPEILQYQEELVDCIMDRIRQQVNTSTLLSSSSFLLPKHSLLDLVPFLNFVFLFKLI